MMLLLCDRQNCRINRAYSVCSEQTASERQDLPCTYLAHHERESTTTFIIINIIITIMSCSGAAFVQALVNFRQDCVYQAFRGPPQSQELQALWESFKAVAVQKMKDKAVAGVATSQDSPDAADKTADKAVAGILAGAASSDAGHGDADGSHDRGTAQKSNADVMAVSTTQGKQEQSRSVTAEEASQPGVIGTSASRAGATVAAHEHCGSAPGNDDVVQQDAFKAPDLARR